ncbi:hypothetical protein [Methylobacterium oxalidis]|uniref:hypothetical protein n=1 Tax=Methylobacterium oxalidis TaxID=944322 RepID=UPI0033152A8D
MAADQRRRATSVRRSASGLSASPTIKADFGRSLREAALHSAKVPADQRNHHDIGFAEACLTARDIGLQFGEKPMTFFASALII